MRRLEHHNFGGRPTFAYVAKEFKAGSLNGIWLVAQPTGGA